MRVGQEFEPADDDSEMPELSDEERSALDERIERPLSGYTTPEIMQELELRYPGFIFHAFMQNTDDKTGSFLWHHGNHHAVIGLIQTAMWKHQREYL